MRALRRDSKQSGDDFPELLQELQTYLGPEQPGQAVKAFPGQGSNVPITLLGSSGFRPNWRRISGSRSPSQRTLPRSISSRSRALLTQFRPSAVCEALLIVAVQ